MLFDPVLLALMNWAFLRIFFCGTGSCGDLNDRAYVHLSTEVGVPVLMNEERLLGLLTVSQIPDANATITAGSGHFVLVGWMKVDGKDLRAVRPVRRRRKGSDAKSTVSVVLLCSPLSQS